MEEGKIRNIIRDTRKNVKFVILANRKLSREEMLKVIRIYNYESVNIRTKPDSEVTIVANEEML